MFALLFPACAFPLGGKQVILLIACRPSRRFKNPFFRLSPGQSTALTIDLLGVIRDGYGRGSCTHSSGEFQTVFSLRLSGWPWRALPCRKESLTRADSSVIGVPAVVFTSPGRWILTSLASLARGWLATEIYYAVCPGVVRRFFPPPCKKRTTP